MKYITGLICFGIPCNEDSCGTWTFSKADYANPEMMMQKESDDSVFKDRGIETNKIILQYGDDTLFNVASHTRAYVDMLEAGEFEKLKGVFYEYIDSKKCRETIFKYVYGYLRHLNSFQAVNSFMSEEFGNAWMSYMIDKLPASGVQGNAEQVSA